VKKLSFLCLKSIG